MKKDDVLFYYDYNDQFKVFKGYIKLLNRIEENYYQERWEVEIIGKDRKSKVWLGKPVEWYSPDKLLPKRINEFHSVNVLIVGYGKIDGRLKYEVSRYDFENNEWKEKSSIDKVLYWKYLENSPVSLINKNI